MVAQPQRTQFLLTEVARIRNGKIIAWHVTGCAALQGEHCTCRAVEYQLVRAEGQATMTSDELLITPEEAARRLSIGRTKCYELMDAGIVPNVKIGRLRRVIASELPKTIEQLREGGDDDKA